MSESDRVLVGAAGIARYLYGSDEPKYQRRVRHLAARGLIPITKVDTLIESRASWLERVYADPDPSDDAGPAQPEPDPDLVDLGECARPGCTARVLIRQDHFGRRPKYCEVHKWK